MRSLSARLLVLTIGFVMLAEVLIFAPSVARYRVTWLEAKIAAGHLAVLALEEAPDNMVSPQLARELLAHVGARGIVLHKPDATRLIVESDMPPSVEEVEDLRDLGALEAIGDAFATLVRGTPRVMRVLDWSPREAETVVELLVDEPPLRQELRAFAVRILQLSLVISLITAALVYFSLRWLLVRPMREIVAAMTAFRQDPEDASRVVVPSARRDEVGHAERELAELQETVRQALAQRAHLAALGTAVSKINHDLKNMLATARLLSDSLAESAAPEVRRVAPRLLDALDRAVALCARTLDFTREGAPPLHRCGFALAELVDELPAALGLPRPDGPELRNTVDPALVVRADRDQLFRVLFNLARNAIEAGAHRVEIGAERAPDGFSVTVADDGPGLPPKARENLFRPFAGSARPGGTGLGLAIGREILRAHGGDIGLERSDGSGTVFRLRLPDGARRLNAAGRAA
jgi:signal transduction histidine kinase